MKALAGVYSDQEFTAAAEYKHVAERIEFHVRHLRLSQHLNNLHFNTICPLTPGLITVWFQSTFLQALMGLSYLKLLFL